MSVIVPVFFNIRMHFWLLVLYKNQFVLFRCLPLIFGTVWHNIMAFFWTARAFRSDWDRPCCSHLSINCPISATLCRQRSCFLIFSCRNRTFNKLIISIRRGTVKAVLKHSDFWKDLIRLFHLFFLRLEFLMSLGKRSKSFLIRYLLSLLVCVSSLIYLTLIRASWALIFGQNIW